LRWRWCSSTCLLSGSREPAGLSCSHRHDSGDSALRPLANARQRFVTAISQGRCEYWMGNHRIVRARDPSRADHVPFHARPRLRERHRLCSELFWPTTRACCCVRSLCSDLSAPQSLHGLSVPGSEVR
jgi:hypothetical protein